MVNCTSDAHVEEMYAPPSSHITLDSSKGACCSEKDQWQTETLNTATRSLLLDSSLCLESGNHQGTDL